MIIFNTQAGHESHSVDQLTAACFEPSNQMVVCDPRAGKGDNDLILIVISSITMMIMMKIDRNDNVTQTDNNTVARKVHGVHDAVPGGRGAERHQQGRRHD